jgi:EAL domain-containing protein (putative c-di-GMP-specific phosphodiesterase class I)
LNATALERLSVEHDLQMALERGEFRLHYQPIFDVATRSLRGAEALLRWQHPVRGLLYPEHFLEVAEQRGMMPGIGAWALAEACRMGQLWSSASGRSLQMAVNVSAQQLVGDGFLGIVERALAESGLVASSLVVELTESMMQSAQARDSLLALRARGVQIAIDDFGTGFSSLAYLRRFPVDVLKIDRSFLVGVPEDDRDGAIVRTIIAMARTLGFTVVAEGVETHAQLEFLRNLECDEAQGYLLARPVEAEEFASAFCLADAPGSAGDPS